MAQKIKLSHVHRLMTRLKRMKENKVICDFTIKVGNKSFPVHRTVLVASSDYFEGLFSSNMKEVREGLVEMKNLGVKAFEQSLDFMYTGSAEITMESVQEILRAAELFQLTGLKSLGFRFLLDNLSPNNCLSVVNLAETYNRPDVKEKAERIIASDLESVMASDMFSSISKPDLLRYISCAGYQTSWKAVITWARDKEEFPQLIETVDIEKFPFKFLLESALEEPLVMKYEGVKKRVINALFSDDEKLKNNLDMASCIDLNTFARNHGVNDAIIDVIMQFIEENFEEIVSTARFCSISKDDVIELFQSPGTKSSSEKVKWGAALKWVNHDVRKRQNVFSELFCLIKLENLPSRFLKDSIRSENLVRNSKKCSDALIDAVLAKAINLEEECSQDGGFIGSKEVSAVSVTNTPQTVPPPDAVDPPWNLTIPQQPDDGSMAACTLLGRLLGYSVFSALVITYTFPAGCIQGISYPHQVFKAYLPDTSGFRRRLEKAFKAGQIFRIEYQTGRTRGRITWGDVPHKTYITGGTWNNGYPDPGYVARLDQALRSKGF